ncbi:hypothetical protein [Methanofollis fontis]|uniref:DUF4760 domain-containing protein n=1 Tax=Methanofollis fontis TaxID=2052832 RepID=A0A483CRW2_9EURY|nr:hypothetical protein [Methanofollis fontis]TAJ44951.1 hypothetical protein CUJ86_06635 [Methanofollis fontis]
MRRLTWEMRLGIFLVAVSVVVYAVKFLVLGNPENTYYYIFNALGFLPINVLLVTLILNQLLSVRAKREKLEKLNMVIGTFYAEVGTHLLIRLSDRDPHLDSIRGDLIVRGDWSDADFAEVRRRLSTYPAEVGVDAEDLIVLKDFLMKKRNFLLRLLENPMLLEHEHFTEVLRAVFHLTDELERREDLAATPETDHKHLSGDINRAYRLLVLSWLDYMKYLKNNYPYLFSLAMRTNPFDQTASPVVLE